jgi:Uma2 family endonuclease
MIRTARCARLVNEAHREVTSLTAAAFEHVLPWDEEDYLALGDTPDRVELFDGSLLVSPAPTFRHQAISRRLANILEPGAAAAGLEVYEAVNVRLKPGRVPIPDIVIVRPVDLDQLVVDVEYVHLVCEITSPSSAGTDRVLKMHHYAEAGIPWYLLVERTPELRLQLFRWEQGGYVRHAEGLPGAPLRIIEPIQVEIDPATLDR